MASTLFFWLRLSSVHEKYKSAMTITGLVTFIAAYHYIRIFNSWVEAYSFGGDGGDPALTGQPFNDAYRYVDWLLTVPLLVAELVAVLALPAGKRGSLMARLIVASALMVALGYPGEIAADMTTRVVWAVASTVPFLYILFVLWVELSKAAESNDAHTKVLLRNTRLLLLATWGFYPIAYMMPMLGIAGGAAMVGLQVGYSIADIAAKCGYGVMITTSLAPRWQRKVMWRPRPLRPTPRRSSAKSSGPGSLSDQAQNRFMHPFLF